MITSEALKEVIDRKRSLRGWTMGDVSEQMGMSRPVLYARSGTAENKGSLELIYRLAEVFDTTPARLISDIERKMR